MCAVPLMAKPKEDILPPKLLNRSEAAEYLGVSLSTLARWAMLRIGPRWTKIGGRARYRLSDLDDYIEANIVIPVADTG